MFQRLDGVREANRCLWVALTPFILQKSRMRKRARTDLCGGRSAMIVPTATKWTGFVNTGRHIGTNFRWRAQTNLGLRFANPGLSYGRLQVSLIKRGRSCIQSSLLTPPG